MLLLRRGICTPHEITRLSRIPMNKWTRRVTTYDGTYGMMPCECRLRYTTVILQLHHHHHRTVPQAVSELPNGWMIKQIVTGQYYMEENTPGRLDQMNKYLKIDFATFHQLMLHAIPSYIFQNPEGLRQLSWTENFVYLPYLVSWSRFAMHYSSSTCCYNVQMVN